MSIEELKNSKLSSIQRSLSSNSSFQFSKGLTDSFDVLGTRQPAEPFWLKKKHQSRLKPVFKVVDSIPPIMSEEAKVEEMSLDSLPKHDPMEIEEIDLTPLLESLSLLIHSNSQIQTDDRSNIIKQIVKLSPAQLGPSLSVFDFPSWTDDITADLIHEMVETNDISTTNITYLLFKAVYPKIASLQASTPRLLMNNLIQLGKKEGKCVSDGIVLPLLFLSDIMRPQQEVVTKIISESLNPSQRFYVFKCILDDGEGFFSHANIEYNTQERKYLRPWKDTSFQILHTLLSVQPWISFTKPCLFDLLHSIQTVVQSNAKDKGSMQLLLLLTSKYAQTLVDNQAIELVEEICQTSTMFLKRAVLGQITTIKKKLQVVSG